MKPRILVPFDFSTASTRALAWAAEFQRAAGGEVRAVHILDPIPIVSVASPVQLPPLTPGEIARVEADLQTEAGTHAPGAQSSVRLGHGAAEEILRDAKEWAATMIVMGTTGKGGIKRVVLGSVADHVVRHAECPVVTVRAPANS